MRGQNTTRKGERGRRTSWGRPQARAQHHKRERKGKGKPRFGAHFQVSLPGLGCLKLRPNTIWVFLGEASASAAGRGSRCPPLRAGLVDPWRE